MNWTLADVMDLEIKRIVETADWLNTQRKREAAALKKGA